MAVNIVASIVAPLFVSANRPERFAKAAASGADAVILDLEDAVPTDAKDAARAALAESRSLAQSGLVARLAFGSADYAADVPCEHVLGALALGRMELVLASRLGRLPSPIDGVTINLAIPQKAYADAQAARSLGLGGKLLIHPR